MDSTVKKGTKIDDAEASKLDPKKRGMLSVDEPEVEGQSARQYLQCPHCAQLGSFEVTAQGYDWFICPNPSCAKPFRA